MSALQKLIDSLGISQAAVGKALGVSKTSMSRIVTKNLWPQYAGRNLEAEIKAWLISQGADEKAVNQAIKPQYRQSNIKRPSKLKKEDGFFMIRKQTLTSAAKRKFGVFREIFADDFESVDDIYFSPDGVYIRESLYSVALHGGFLALVGESGSGKSTQIDFLVARLSPVEKSKVIIISPYVLGADGEGRKGPTVTAGHICESILTALGQKSTNNLSAQGLFRLTHNALKASHQLGYRHVLLLDEGHDLPDTLFRHLKRFYELKSGVNRLLSIIIVAQNEFKDKFSETNAKVKEVVQRMELLEMAPLDDLEGFVRHRCQSAGAKFEAIFEKDALPALQSKLRGPSPKGRGEGKSLLFPQNVGNTLTRAMNKAAELGLPKVNAEVITEAA